VIFFSSFTSIKNCDGIAMKRLKLIGMMEYLKLVFINPYLRRQATFHLQLQVIS